MGNIKIVKVLIPMCLNHFQTISKPLKEVTIGILDTTWDKNKNKNNLIC